MLSFPVCRTLRQGSHYRLWLCNSCSAETNSIQVKAAVGRFECCFSACKRHTSDSLLVAWEVSHLRRQSRHRLDARVSTTISKRCWAGCLYPGPGLRVPVNNKASCVVWHVRFNLSKFGFRLIKVFRRSNAYGRAESENFLKMCGEARLVGWRARLGANLYAFKDLLVHTGDWLTPKPTFPNIRQRKQAIIQNDLEVQVPVGKLEPCGFTQQRLKHVCNKLWQHQWSTHFNSTYRTIIFNSCNALKSCLWITQNGRTKKNRENFTVEDKMVPLSVQTTIADHNKVLANIICKPRMMSQAQVVDWIGNHAAHMLNKTVIDLVLLLFFLQNKHKDDVIPQSRHSHCQVSAQSERDHPEKTIG